MQPVFEETQIAEIAKVFKRSKLDIDSVCNWTSVFEVMKEKNIEMQSETLNDGNTYLSFFTWDKFAENPAIFLKNKILSNGPYGNGLYLFKENITEIRKQFQFQVKVCYWLSCHTALKILL